MPVIGIALVWGAYTLGLWGYCLVRGYNVTLPQLLSTSWPPVAAKQGANEGKSGFGSGSAGAGGGAGGGGGQSW